MPLTLRVLLALVLGLVIGAALEAVDFAGLDAVVSWAEPIGGLWLDALRMTIVPLVFSLVVTGMVSARGAAEGGGAAARALVLFAVLLFASASFSALFTPAVLQAWPIPADAALGLKAAVAGAGPAPSSEMLPLGQWVRSFLPVNPVGSAAAGDMAPLVIFAVLFALAAARIPAVAKERLTGLFDAIAQTMLVLVGWVLWIAPLGVFALALGVGAHAGIAAAGVLGHYLVVLSGVSVTVTLLLYAVAALAGRISPWRFARAAAPAQVVAFSTQSSIASLPAMLAGTEGVGVPRQIAGVVLPLAVSLFRITSPAANLAVAIYVAGVFGVALTPGQLFAGVGVAAVLSLAAVGLPGQTTFFTTTVPICLTMGVPLELLPVLLAVEVVPDIFRTVGNVTGDIAATTVIARFDGDAPAPP